MGELPIYLDYQATTPLDPRVLEAMAPYWRETFGNPHSRGHRFGWDARQAVEIARSQVAPPPSPSDAGHVRVQATGADSAPAA